MRLLKSREQDCIVEKATSRQAIGVHEVNAAPPILLTARRLAADLGQPLHRVNYVLATRHHIRPAAYAGNSRVYDAKAKAQLRHELNAMDARRHRDTGARPCN